MNFFCAASDIGFRAVSHRDRPTSIVCMAEKSLATTQLKLFVSMVSSLDPSRNGLCCESHRYFIVLGASALCSGVSMKRRLL